MIADLTTTADLAAWFQMSRVAVLKRLTKEGLQPISKGAHGVAKWDRQAALAAMQKTRG